MAGSYELNAFVAKFYDLWFNGCEADLHVRCFNGYSYVNLQAGLGYARSTGNFKAQDGCKAKWFKKRKHSGIDDGIIVNECNVAGENGNETGINLKNENSDCVIDSTTDDFIEDNLLESNDNTAAEEGDNVQFDQGDDGILSEVNDGRNMDTTNSQAVIENPEDDCNSSAVNTDEPSMNEEEVATTKDSSCSSKLDVVELYATAVFENSPYEMLNQEEFQSLGRFATSADHLARNILRVIIDRHDSRSAADGKFVHSAQVRIHVRTDRLWESPRSYVWKHLGQDTWDRGNGTRITLRRIHQKN